jgi:alkylation response protein AidB-like acyl-CoA dehydrogenase
MGARIFSRVPTAGPKVQTVSVRVGPIMSFIMVVPAGHFAAGTGIHNGFMLELNRDLHRFQWQEVREKAAAIDQSTAPLGEVIDSMCERGWMALRLGPEWGGPGLSEGDFRDFQIDAARCSGAFAFLQTQHQSAAVMIARSENEALKADILPKMVDGRRLVGVGFSQLRRSGPPIMRATATDGGYLLQGHVPWVTGYGYYPEFLIGAQLPDGRALFGLVPLALRDPKDIVRSGNYTPVSKEVQTSAPMQLAAMGTANTVTLDINGYFLPQSDVAMIRPEGWIQRNDRLNITLQANFAVGCARAGLDVLEQNARKKDEKFVWAAFEALYAEHVRCLAALAIASGTTDDATIPQRLAARAWAIDVMQRCAWAAVTSSSGAANSLQHPAQRILREALVFTVSAQTGPVMEATLGRLTGSRG